jgi:redox-sensitive bicupin YhaK (pirin superfamily)
MEILNKASLPLGGFAGLKEHRLVTDSRVFGTAKPQETYQGLGNFVYLADAFFNPKGETGMHPHREIDVISVMIEGQISHQGSLEHGKSLSAGDVQVQRAGGEGFSHNEINPDETPNRMIQLWVLPETKGQPAGYKVYTPKHKGLTRIYGNQSADTPQSSETFASDTLIDILKLAPNESFEIDGSSLIYITKGEAKAMESNEQKRVDNGDLIKADRLKLIAETSIEAIVISTDY